MTTSEQFTDFKIYAENVLASQGDELPLDEIFSRWWQQQHQDDDLQAVLEAHAQYNCGERGEDVLQS